MSSTHVSGSWMQEPMEEAEETGGWVGWRAGVGHWVLGGN